jgi:hypothetical protein
VYQSHRLLIAVQLQNGRSLSRQKSLSLLFVIANSTDLVIANSTDLVKSVASS